MRKLCKTCQQRPAAINYYKQGRPYFRSQCDHCATGRRDGKPLWQLAGYKKKTICDRCNFTSKYPEQFNVFYVDGNPSNCRFTNLKSVCANCQRLNLPWRQGDLKPDF